MRSARHTVPLVQLTSLLLAGCSPVSLGTSTSSGTQSPVTGAPTGSGRAITVGAGPQKHYTVQKQPAAGSCHYRYLKEEPLEDPTCMLGAISPAVTQANLASTITSHVWMDGQPAPVVPRPPPAADVSCGTPSMPCSRGTRR
ncbi:hypothetical protein [Streptomyces canus]|uniref:hypothetical protein n=1 Tax=Streptomyces canus TaxID=58343 RepID=UPI002DD8EC32|nr:hypothetical protein [Streptomyces canus]WSD91695.1 hypothetical protein OG925_48695 [Streptomyces canus]